ncbi:MAG: histidine phosphatase family protein [Bavariicoccus seileri]|uniref:histidine phosphatase family protein n=1 Tax=Bavariicoccus seileri TaxID=549685 RepID=UPI003F9825FB
MTKNGVTLYFMRHGQTYFNMLERMQGWSDTPLTDKGRIDVLRSGYGLKDIKFDAVYTSDLRRTVETAQLALKYNDYNDGHQTIHMMPEFREVFFGTFEGLSGKEVWHKVREVGYEGKPFDRGSKDVVLKELNAFKIADENHLAENFNEFWSRVERGLITVLKRHRETNQNILIVSHGMTIRNIMHELTPDFSLETPIENAAVTVTDYYDGKFHLKALNQTSHFADKANVSDDPFDELDIAMYQ